MLYRFISSLGLFTFLLILSMQSVQSQSDDHCIEMACTLPTSISVDYQINEISAHTSYQAKSTVYVWLSLIESAFDDVFLTELLNKAEISNLDIVYLTENELKTVPNNAPLIHIAFSINPDDSQQIISQIQNVMLTFPSNIIAPKLSTAFSISINPEAHTDKIAFTQDYIIAEMLYASDNCEVLTTQTEKIKNYSLDDLRFSEDDRNTYTIGLDFYQANCAIIAGNIELAQNFLRPTLDMWVNIDNTRTPYPLLALTTNLAWTHLQQGQTEAAFNLMTENSDHFTNEYRIDWLKSRAQLHALAFYFDPAISDITSAIQIAETTSVEASNKAQLYKQRGDHIFLIYEWDRVLADYDRAIGLDPTYADAYFSRGILYYTQGPRPNALVDFEKFVELAPEDLRVQEANEYIKSIQVELEALGGDDIGAFGPSN